MEIGDFVSTPYGIGSITEIRDNDFIIVKPTEWTMAGNQKATFYLHRKDVKIRFLNGDKISCSFGEGIVQEYRKSDGVYVIHLVNWKLATHKSPVLYLQESAVSKCIPRKVPIEEIIAEAHIKNIAAANKAKHEGNELFSKKTPDYVEAKQKYAIALRVFEVFVFLIFYLGLF
jgi:hypothetical protein